MSCHTTLDVDTHTRSNTCTCITVYPDCHSFIFSFWSNVNKVGQVN